MHSLYSRVQLKLSLLVVPLAEVFSKVYSNLHFDLFRYMMQSIYLKAIDQARNLSA